MFTLRDLYTALGIVVFTAVILVGVKLVKTRQFSLPRATSGTANSINLHRTITLPVDFNCELELIYDAASLPEDSDQVFFTAQPTSGDCTTVDYIYKITKLDTNVQSFITQPDSDTSANTFVVNDHISSDGRYTVVAKACPAGDSDDARNCGAGDSADVYTNSYIFDVEGDTSQIDCVPTQLSPSEGSTIQGYPVTFAVEMSCEDVGMVQVIATQGDKSRDIYPTASLDWSIETSDEWVTLFDDPYGSFRWKVRTCSSNTTESCTGAWSEELNYTVVDPDTDECSPILVSPADGSIVETPLSLSWDNSCNVPDYEFLVQDSSNSINDIVTDSLAETSSVTLNDLSEFADDEIITWKVRTCSDDLSPCKDPGPWSQTRTFSLNTASDEFPDFEVTSITRTGSADAYSYNIIITNLGPNDVGFVDVVADIYVNPVNVPPTSADIPDDSFTHSIGLPVGESFDAALINQTDAEAIICVVVDRDNTIEEVDDTNNVACYDMSTSQPYIPPYSLNLRDYLIDYTTDDNADPINFIRMIRDHFFI